MPAVVSGVGAPRSALTKTFEGPAASTERRSSRRPPWTIETRATTTAAPAATQRRPARVRCGSSRSASTAASAARAQVSSAATVAFRDGGASAADVNSPIGIIVAQ